MIPILLCTAHQQAVVALPYGTFHTESGHLCTSAYIVTPAGPRPAETLRAQARLAEGLVTP